MFKNIGEEETIHCNQCFNILKKANCRPNKCIQCFDCEQFFCLDHFELDSQNTEKEVKYYGKEQILDISSPNEDEETFSTMLNCPTCKKETRFQPRFTTMIGPCLRCDKSLFEVPDGSLNSSEMSRFDHCRRHTGEHELPLDKWKKPTFGNFCCDIGGQYGISSIKPMVLPGRWTCCGEICYHNHPNCPYFAKSFYSVYFCHDAEAHVPSKNEIGCQVCPHETSLSNLNLLDAKKTYEAPVEMECCTGDVGDNHEVILEKVWNARIRWNFSEPFIYEKSGTPVHDCVKRIAKLSAEEGLWG